MVCRKFELRKHYFVHLLKGGFVFQLFFDYSNDMKKSYVFLGVIVCALVVFGRPVRAHAAWPLNTPNAQTNPFWAGDNLVWNDDRLGTDDIFIRTPDGVIQPLIVEPGAQTLLGASAKAVFYADSGVTTRILLLDPKTRVLTQIVPDTEVVSASVFDNQLAWSDGVTLWWWNGAKLRNRALVSAQFRLTPLGVVWILPSSVVLWSGTGDQTIFCHCVDVSYIDDQIVLSAEDASTLWPSGTGIPPRGNLQTNGHALLYQKNGNKYLWRAGRVYPLTIITVSDLSLGSGGIAEAVNGDIVLNLADDPTLNVTVQPTVPNNSSYAGTSSAALVRLVARSGSTTITREAAPVDGSFQFTDLLQDAPDGLWNITLTGENSFGATTELKLTPLTIDHTPPQPVREPEIAVADDSVRIHWDTNEKADTGIVLAGTTDDQAKTHQSSRLTFSHTTTITDLDPDETYTAHLQSNDVAKNAVRMTRSFSTPSLLAATMKISSVSDIESQKAGIWQGKVLVEPGVIGATVMVLDLDYLHLQSDIGTPIIVAWTIGLPPEGVKRGSIVRVKGTINTAGDRILAHRPKALAIIKTGDPPLVVRVTSGSLKDTQPFQWLELSGELTSVTKQSWKITGSDVLLYWNTAQSGYQKGQTVSVQGFWYIDVDAPRFVASTARNLQDIVSATAVATPSLSGIKVVPPAVIHYRTISTTHTEVVTPARVLQNQTILEETSLETADLNTNLWYNAILMMLGVAVYRRFFFT